MRKSTIQNKWKAGNMGLSSSASLDTSGVLRLLPELPRLLLDHGADTTAKDTEKKWTPLQWAEANLEDETDRAEVIALLRGHEANMS